MSAMLKNLLDKRAKAWAEAQDVRARLEDDKYELTDDDDATFKRALDDVARFDGLLEDEKRAAKIGAALDGSTDAKPAAPSATEDRSEDTDTDYRTAFELWTRFGASELSGDQRKVLRAGAVTSEEQRELRAQGVGVLAGGGYTVPDEFRNKLVETLKYFSGMRQAAEIITTESGASLPWMTNDDTANVGAILAENTQVTEQDVAFGTAALDAYMYTSKLVRVSLQLIQDSALNIDEFLPRKLGERIGRIQNQHFTTGTGTAQPQGLITGATATVAAVGQSTAFTYDTLIDATARLDPSYLQGGNLAWMTSMAGLTAFRKLKDTQGRPLWQPSLTVGAPDSFLGYPIILNNDMPAPGVSTKSLAFGDFRQAYVIRDVTGVRTLRLDERYADFLQVGFLAFQRSGGIVQNTGAVTVIQHAAT